MASIPYQNPGSNEVQSPLIAGLSEGLKKVSEILNLKTTVITDIPLFMVEGNRIYEASQGNKLWLADTEFQLKKNGIIVSKETMPYIIDYVGGSVTFDKPLTDEDKLTVTVKRISNDSVTINSILENITNLQSSIGQYKGYFNTYEELSAQYPTGVEGEYSFVAVPNFAMFAWDKEQGKWRNTQSVEDLSKYYDKNKIDELLSTKQPTISFTQKATDFYAGDGSFRDLANDVRASKLTGLTTKDTSNIAPTDNLITGLGKIQGQINNIESKVNGKTYLSGNGEPNTSTKGEIGQRYIDIATGKWYTCTKIAENSYNWEQGFSSEERTKLANLSNYDDTKVKAEIATNAADILLKANKSKSYTLTVPTSGWSSEKPFTQTIAVESMVDDGTPLFGLSEYTKEQTKAMSFVSDYETKVGAIILTAKEDKPTVDINMKVVVVY